MLFYVAQLLLVQQLVQAQIGDLTFQGCFRGHDMNFDMEYTSRNNINLDCAEFCQDQGFVIAATKDEYCGCAQTLPLPQLARPEYANATGPSSECNLRCPGSYNSGQCYDDECCGGPNAFTAYTTGPIDVLMQIMRRAKANVRNDKRYFMTRYFQFLPHKGSRFTDHGEIIRITGIVHVIEECEDKCLQHWDCDGYQWNIYSKQCQLWRNAQVGIQDQAWISATVFWGFRRAQDKWINNDAKFLQQIKFEWTFKECEDPCIANPNCNGYTWNDWTRDCQLFSNARDWNGTPRPDYNTAILMSEDTSDMYVLGKAISVNPDNERAFRSCKLYIDSFQEECWDIENEPTEDMYLFVESLERELEHDLGLGLTPWGQDLEYDNYNSNTEATMTQGYSMTTGTETDYTTESGTSVSSSVTHETKIGIASMKNAISSSGFFNFGHSMTETEEYTEERTFEFTIPPGHKGYLNCFRETYDLEVIMKFVKYFDFYILQKSVLKLCCTS